MLVYTKVVTHSLHSTVYSIQCVRYAVISAVLTPHYVVDTVCPTQCTIQHTVYAVLYSVHCTLYTVYSLSYMYMYNVHVHVAIKESK